MNTIAKHITQSLLAVLLVGPAVAAAQNADLTVAIDPLTDLPIFGRREPNPGKITVGQNKIYAVTITNNGPSTAIGLEVAKPDLDTRLKIASVSGCVLKSFTPAGSTTAIIDPNDARSWPCTIGTLPDLVDSNATEVDIEVAWPAQFNAAGKRIPETVCPTAAAPLAATSVTVTTSGTVDPVPGDNQAIDTPVADALADLTVDLTTDVTSGGPGTVFTITGTVTNTGPCAAVAVTAIDRDGISDGKITNVADSTTGVCAGDVDVLFSGCPIGDMASGAVATFSSKYVVGSMASDELQRGTIANINAYSRGRSYFVNRPASGDGRTFDPDEGDNLGTVVVISKQDVSSCSTGGIPGVLGLLALGLPLIRRRRK